MPYIDKASLLDACGMAEVKDVDRVLADCEVTVFMLLCHSEYWTWRHGHRRRLLGG